MTRTESAAPIVPSAATPIIGKPIAEVTGARAMAHNTLWSLVGKIVPMLGALVSIPILIRALGTDRFGVLTLAWILVGYFSLFDLGLSRALTYFVARKEGAGQQEDLISMIWTALILMCGLGVFGAIVMAGLSPLLVARLLKVPVSIQPETLSSFYLLSLSLPLVIVAAGLKGLLQARHRFDLVNIAGVPIGLLNFVAPLAILPYYHDLFHVIALLVAVRALDVLVHGWLCQRVFSGFLGGRSFHRVHVRELLSYSGWLTASNILGPFSLYIDRFMIGSIISVTAVAFYTVPYEMITKMLIVSGAIGGVSFPAFSSSFVADPARAADIYLRGLKTLFVLTFPAILIVVLFSTELMSAWLGATFALQSVRVLQVLAIGIFIFGMESIPYMLVQGAGRPDITTKLLMFELPFYVGLIWWLTKQYGINGAAIAWLVRVSADTVLLMFIGNRILPVARTNLAQLVWGFLVCIGALFAAMAVSSVAMKISFLAIGLAGFALFAWLILLSNSERAFFRSIIAFRAQAAS